MLPEYLSTTCPDPHCDSFRCYDVVRQRADTRRWYITFGHAGFNSPANNDRGYETRGRALSRSVQYYQKGHFRGRRSARRTPAGGVYGRVILAARRVTPQSGSTKRGRRDASPVPFDRRVPDA